MGYLKRAQENEMAGHKARLAELRKNRVDIQGLAPTEKHEAFEKLEAGYAVLADETRKSVASRAENFTADVMVVVWGICVLAGTIGLGIVGGLWGAVAGAVGSGVLGLGAAGMVGGLIAAPFEFFAKKKDTKEYAGFVAEVDKERQGLDADISAHIQQFPEELMESGAGMTLMQKGGDRGRLLRQSFEKAVADNAVVMEELGRALKEVSASRPDITSRFAESLNKSRGLSHLKKVANF